MLRLWSSSAGLSGPTSNRVRRYVCASGAASGFSFKLAAMGGDVLAEFLYGLSASGAGLLRSLRQFRARAASSSGLDDSLDGIVVQLREPVAFLANHPKQYSPKGLLLIIRCGP